MCALFHPVTLVLVAPLRLCDGSWGRHPCRTCVLACFTPGDIVWTSADFQEFSMAKGQKKSNREKKKPKQDKKTPQPGQSPFGKKPG